MKVQFTSKEATAFRRHLATLGLDTIEAYRIWRRDHGFDDAVKKHWRERRKE